MPTTAPLQTPEMFVVTAAQVEDDIAARVANATKATGWLWLRGFLTGGVSATIVLYVLLGSYVHCRGSIPPPPPPPTTPGLCLALRRSPALPQAKYDALSLTSPLTLFQPHNNHRPPGLPPSKNKASDPFLGTHCLRRCTHRIYTARHSWRRPRWP